MVEQSVNLEANAAIQKLWDDASGNYDRHLIQFTYQPYITLCVHSEVQNKKRILDIACGSALHSLYLSKTMMSPGSILVCTDISKKMLEIAKARLEDPSSNHGCKVSFTSDEVAPLDQHTFDIEEEFKKHTDKESDKLIIGCRANNESLPFKDESFDCYIANLSLMLVNNYKNQLSEAFRVTQKGGSATFTIWGRVENTAKQDMLMQVALKHNLGPLERAKMPSFKLGKDLAKLKEDFQEVGFTKVKLWYQPMQFKFNDFEHFFSLLMKNSLIPLDHLEHDKLMQVKEDFEKLYNEKMGADVINFQSFEVAIITAEKAQ